MLGFKVDYEKLFIGCQVNDLHGDRFLYYLGLYGNTESLN